MGKLTNWEVTFLKQTVLSIKKDGLLVMFNTNSKYTNNKTTIEVVKFDNSNLL